MNAAPILRIVAGGVGVLAVLFAAGWLAPTSTDAPVRAIAGPRAPVFVHPNAVLAEAARRFRMIGGAMAPENYVDVAETADADTADTSIDVTPAAAASPQVDVSQSFRRDLSAVISENGVIAVLLRTPGEGARRVSVGGLYRDGWRVAAISPEEIVLRKRHETRRVTVIGEYQQASMTNSVEVSGAADRPTRPRLVLTRQDARARTQ